MVNLSDKFSKKFSGDKNILLSSALIFAPIFFLTFSIFFIRSPVIMGYALWVMQILFCISLPVGVGMKLKRWALKKNNPLISQYTSITSYVIAAVLTSVVILPGLYQLASETIASFDPPNETRAKDVVAQYYSKLQPGSYVNKVYSMHPNYKEWVIDAEICMPSKNNPMCVPMLTSFDTDYRITSSQFNTDRSRKVIEEILESKK
jgi:hypothetical protein